MHRLDELLAVALNFFGCGCGRIFDAATRSSLREEMTRASTAALIVEITTECSMADCNVHKSGAFLPGFVENHIDQRLAGVGIDFAENLRRDFDQITVELALVPFRENFREFVARPCRATSFRIA